MAEAVAAHPLWEQLGPFLERPPTSCLVQAPPGEDLWSLMVAWASALLCTQRQPGTRLACGGCASCGWMAARQHPDVRWVMPEALWLSVGGPEVEADAGQDAGAGTSAEMGGEGSEGAGSDKGGSWDIKIGQIRALEEFANLSAHRGGPRLVVLGPVECLNTPAANALLKSLEEPPPGLRFLLWSERSQGIPATVLSRCRRLRMARAGEGGARSSGSGALRSSSIGGERIPLALLGQGCSESPESWLLPLVVSGRVSPTAWAERAGKTPPEAVIQWLLLWLIDTQAVMQGAPAAWFDRELRAQPLPADVDARARRARHLAEGTSRLQALLRHAGHPLNPKLFFEQIFEAYRLATSP